MSQHRGSLSSVFRGALGLGAPNASAAPSASAAQGGKQQAALNIVRTQADNLEKRAAHLEKKADEVRAQAKIKFKAGDKSGASLLLKKETMFRKQAENAQAQQLKLESQALALETLTGNADTVNAMRTAKSTQEHLLKGVTSDEIADLMADTQGLNDEADEIARLLGEPDPSDALLDESIENELAAMEAEEEADKPAAKVRLPKAPSHPVALPKAPVHAPKVKVAVELEE